MRTKLGVVKFGLMSIILIIDSRAAQTEMGGTLEASEILNGLQRSDSDGRREEPSSDLSQDLSARIRPTK